MVLFVLTVILLGIAVQAASVKGRKNPLTYDCIPSVKYCEPEEKFTVISRFGYDGRFPVRYFQVKEHFPEGIILSENELQTVEAVSQETAVWNGLIIHAREVVKRTRVVSFPHRGAYQFQGCEMILGDWMGQKQLEWSKEKKRTVYVYPARYNSRRLEHNLQQMYEDVTLRRSMLRDTIQTAGYHEYTGREPMKQIHYKQSARMNRFMVREYEYIQQEKMNVVLDLNYKGDMDLHFQRLENLLSITRTIVEWLEKKRIPYKLITNAIIPGYQAEILRFEGEGSRNKSSLNRILHLLARTNCGVASTTDELWTSILQKAEGGSFLYLTAGRDAKTNQLIARLARQNIYVYPYYAEVYEEEGEKP